MDADALASSVTKSSAALILTMQKCKYIFMLPQNNKLINLLAPRGARW